MKAAGKAGVSAQMLPREDSGLSVLLRLVRMGATAWGRLALAGLVGVCGSMATVGLLAGSGYVIDRAAQRPGLGAIAGLLAAVEVLAFLRGPLRYAERLLGHDVAFRALSGWRVWLYDQLEPRVPVALAAWRSGDLLARSIEDVDALQDLHLRTLLPIATTSAAALLGVTVVAVILPDAGWILAGAIVVAFVAGPFAMSKSESVRGRKRVMEGILASEVVDLVQGAPDLLAFGGEDALLARIAEADRELIGLARRRAFFTALSSAVVTLCLGGAVVGVVLVGIAAVHSHRMGSVMLAVLPLAVIGTFEAVPGLSSALLGTADVVAAGRRLFEVAGVPVPVVDPVAPRDIPEGCPEVAFEGAALRYRTDLPWVLHDFSLELPPASRVALVGPSGAGKSSVVHVMLRFWELNGGSATIAGIGIDEVAQADIRRRVALVDQEARLFSGSIRRNIALGRPEASDEEIAEVVRLAQLSDWVASLPQGLDTPVGEHAARVSGGQRRRIAFARALLTGAELLILDEPTAGLDDTTAARLLADVLEASAGRSIFLVTHRVADLVGFERVAVIAGGKIESASL